MDRGLSPVHGSTVVEGVGTVRNLLIVAQLPPPVHGAAVVNQMVVNSSILRRHFNVRVIPIDATTELSEIRKFSVGKVLRTFRMLTRVMHCLIRDRPDLAYLTLAPKGFAFYRDAVVVALFRLWRTPHVLHLHGRGMKLAHTGVISSAVARFLMRKGAIVHLSQALVDDIAAFAPLTNVQIVPNGVADPTVSEPLAPPRMVQKKQTPTILFLGTMLESKGPLVLVEALGLLQRRGVEFHAVFAGPWRGSLTQERFDEAVSASNLSSAVQHVGPVYGKAKSETLLSADIMAFPTHYENEAFPLVVLEGMAAGLVPVTSNIAALPDIVEGVGECVPPQDAAALADALQKYLVNPELLHHSKLKARSKYESQFTQQHFEERLSEVLLSAVGADKTMAACKTV